jgi:hypothetical protein
LHGEISIQIVDSGRPKLPRDGGHARQAASLRIAQLQEMIHQGRRKLRIVDVHWQANASA